MKFRSLLAAVLVWNPTLACSGDTPGRAAAGGNSTGGATAGGSSAASTSQTSLSGSNPPVLGGASTVVSNRGGAPNTLVGSTGKTSNNGGNSSSVATLGVGGSTGNGGNTISSSGTTVGVGGSGATLVLPEANASFDYQIGGAYTPPAGVRVVSRDRNSPPAAGLYNICYVNGFQIQPDEEAFWTSEHPSLILRNAGGDPVTDEDWDEMLLDTSTPEKRSQLAAIVGEWISGCKTAGYAAVEVDNLDSYGRSNGLLTQANNVAFMAQLSAIAHARGLAIAQKNSSELLGSVPAMGTDFAVVEECNRYAECGDYQAVYGNRLFVIEYRAQDFDAGCRSYPELSIVLRDLDVSAPTDSNYVYQGC